MSTYRGQTPPSSPVDPRIISFFEHFYAVSDNPTAHEEYAQLLTADADFIMGSKKVQGYDAILAARKALWSGPVQTRHHKLDKIFPFGQGSREVMLYGTVDYGLKNGKAVSIDWAGKAVLVDVDGELKMAFYQVYLSFKSTPTSMPQSPEPRAPSPEPMLEVCKS
ncbi:hypothetical protein A1O3_09559 [Capronia epimyces CBS 606.96]|uniref:SnoaL-like domain-containing protein n=1 Tax=Capronia epimyces CBS 606.96 TaxID=1182542 RepID=W9XAV1_9EURO|nr:uncharacterized protein A1O3_09559 [Capronia epimyces CBS 606.96]EXJ77333.1 hypothetical protein A1O3_09559 [Capronia epimyces CBS 606.96]